MPSDPNNPNNLNSTATILELVAQMNKAKETGRTNVDDDEKSTKLIELCSKIDTLCQSAVEDSSASALSLMEVLSGLLTLVAYQIAAGHKGDEIGGLVEFLFFSTFMANQFERATKL